MKKVLLALAVLGLVATEAAAQGWGGGPPPGYRPPPPEYRPPPPPPPEVTRRPISPYGLPPQQLPPRRGPPVIIEQPPIARGGPPVWRHRRSFDWCQVKAQRLHEFEYRMQMDGRISRDEMRIARSLRADLGNSCGGGRWAPNRGWYYR